MKQKITLVLNHMPEEAADNIIEWLCESADSMVPAGVTIEYRIEDEK